MASFQLANCLTCNALFKRVSAPLCPQCISKEYEQFQQLFRELQRSQTRGGIFISDLAQHVGISIEEIQTFYLEGRFGTAGIFLKFKCKNCQVVIQELTRKGRYCLTCSESVSSKAGVQVRSLQSITREAERVQRNKEIREQFKSALAKPVRRRRRAGFIRNSLD